MHVTSAIALRIFSGPHIGAELHLPLGDHVIGSEDSCDIILVDGSLLGRHALIRVTDEATDSGPNARENSGLADGQGESQGDAQSESQSVVKPSLTVFVLPLDGQMFVSGEMVGPQGVAIAACTLFEVGTTSIAWNTVGEPWSDMSGSRALYQGGNGALGLAESGTIQNGQNGQNGGIGLADSGASAENFGGDASLAFYDDIGVGLDADSERDGTGDGAGANVHQDAEPLSLGRKVRNVASLPLKTLMAIFLAILCICGVMVSFEGRAPDMAVHAKELESQLHAMGMTEISVAKTNNGILVQGVLDSHAQRTELWRVTSGLLYPVEIDTTVREDLLLAVQAAFNSRHVYPEVVSVATASGTSGTSGTAGTTGAEPTSAEASATQVDAVPVAPDGVVPVAQNDAVPVAQDDVSIQISGYFQDGQVEAWAFQSMREDVPTSFTVKRKVRHKEDVQAVLEPALLDAKLEHVRTRYMLGVVQVAGHFDLDQHEALDKVLMAVQDTLGVPIRFEVYADLPESIQVAAASNTSDSRALEDAHKEAKKEATLTGDVTGDVSGHDAVNPLGSLKVVSVTLMPLCFFTTDDGQRFFEGAVLPSGYSIEKITMDALTLKKDGAERVHDLRGNHDERS